jgi:urate oxidase / 2-oxo-4-hydroxy-4-carboxy-5-ureidoimidazoline decarboxylase
LTDARISYGKLSVPVHLVRGERLLAADVSMEVLGQGFLPAYTEGDNAGVVATDTMKNVILRRAHQYDPPVLTLEGLLYDLGRGFLATYPEMEGLRLWAEAQPWVAEGGRVFRRVEGDHAVASLELARAAAGGEVGLVAHEAGHVGLRLLKTTGSAFTKFARDDDTTLPERRDRPLFIHLDVRWRYGDVLDAVGAGHVADADVLAVVLETYDDFVSESIQHLVYEMGQRLLSSFPALAQVSFRGENHTHDPVPGAADEPDPLRKTYTSPFPAWGLITLVLDR